MSRLRLYLDEDSTVHALVNALRDRGADVVTAREAGQSGMPDEFQLQWAAQRGRVLYSFNARDFVPLHRAWITRCRAHGGIILGAQQRYSVGEQMRRLLRLIASHSAEEFTNRLEFLSQWS